MTKLEKELQVAILDNGADYAKAAAEVAKRYIEKVVLDLAGFVVTYDELEKWKKENGVTGEVNS